MAKLVPSDIAPEDFKTFSTAQVTVELPYETDDPDVISNAAVHPWVDVDYGELAVDNPPSTSLTLPPELDGLSRLNSKASDPEVVKEAQEARTHFIAPVAIDAAPDLDQNKAKSVGPVAVTTAAAEKQEATEVTDGGSNAAALVGAKPKEPKAAKSTTKEKE